MRLNVRIIAPIAIALSLLVFPGLYAQTKVTKALAIQAVNANSILIRNDSVLSKKIPRVAFLQIEKSLNDTSLIEEISLTDSATLLLVPAESGWYLVSSSVETTPILAYFPDVNKPNIADFPPQAKELISMYEIQIAQNQNRSMGTQKLNVHPKWEEVISKTASNQSTKHSISPFLETVDRGNLLWGQTNSGYGCEKSYNKFCPIISDASDQCDKAAVGCVAVAIAQIMWYWQWPYTAQVPTTVGGDVYTFRYYDWTQIPNSITRKTTIKQAENIAKFLRDCGYQLDMDYGKSSGASDKDALSALAKFGYNPNTMRLVKKINTEGWSVMFYDELAQGRVVYYAGYSNIFGTSGHAFVLDGYDATDDRYHINFGWRGAGNAYYKLDDIFSEDANISFNYKYHQSAIVGIEPLCVSRTYSNFTTDTNPFYIANGGDLIMNNTNISANSFGSICSGSQVRLTNGFTAKAGCSIRIGIDDIACGKGRRQIMQRQTFNDDDNVGVVALSNSSSELEVKDRVIDHYIVYGIGGQVVMYRPGDNLDISALPAGFYVVQTVWDDGSVSSEKIVKQ